MALIFYMMITSHPRRTGIYRLAFAGVVISGVEIIVHHCLFDFSRHHLHNVTMFAACSVIYYYLYTVLLSLIYAYVALLSYEKKRHVRRLVISLVTCTILGMGVFFILLFQKKLYVRGAANEIYYTRWFQIYLFYGMFDAVCCMLTTIFNRKYIPRRAVRCILIFCPIDILMLIYQFIRPSIQFASLTYVIPFLLFYIMFHSNPYDEISGCQNYYSYISRFYENIRLRRKFMVICLEFPRYKASKHLYDKELIDYLSATICRQMESIHSSISLYSLKDYQYAMFVNINNPQKEKRLIKKVRDILDTPVSFGDEVLQPLYKLIVFRSTPQVNTQSKLTSLQKYLFDKMSAESISECYEAGEADYQEFMESYQVEQLLMQIKSERNLNDEHVLCFAQPIYNVEHDSFRTAEALMRLEIDGRIIYPDKFIPVAEQNNSIHILTCIILNKVCQKVRELSASYDFDAITVNCSTSELSNPHLHKELLQIIRQNEVDCSKICLELTESAMFDDYSIVLYNIQKLREAGVQFYLDDFGTGYSNLERILSCPFKMIKFDKSLLYKSMDDAAMQDLLQSMVTIFKRKGFQLLVEGVEDAYQNEYSIAKGFEYIQGYNYSRPQPIDKLQEYFSHK